MRIIYLSFFILCNIYSQEKQIIVKDSLSEETIPLVSIKYLGVNGGTFCDDKGRAVVESEIDSIKLTCVGFIQKKIKVSNIDSIVYLIPKAEKLDEVVLFTKSKNQKNYKKYKSKNKVSFKTNSKGFLFAKMFSFSKKTKLLKFRADIENDSTPKNLVLKVFSTNNENKPSVEVLSNHLYSIISPNQRFVDLNFEDKNIYLKKGNYFIALVITSNSVEKTKLKIGINTSKKLDSYFKPYFTHEDFWTTLPSIRGVKFNNFNFNILTE